METGRTRVAQKALPRVLVLGGAGFIGRHVVQALARRGCSAAVGTRHPLKRSRAQGAAQGDFRQVRMEAMLQAGDWERTLEDFDVVVNCVGILRQRGRETYRRVHHLGPAALAAACRQRALRLVHVSALGIDADLHSRFPRSKRDGEAALRASGADCHIVRPSLLDGPGGSGARWIRRVARWPVQPFPRGATGRIAVLDVVDLGDAIATLALTGAEQCEHQLGGLQERTLAEHLAAMRALYTPRPARPLPIPDPIARLVAHVCDVLHWTPFSYGHFELLHHDNVARPNRLPELLGRAPRAVGAVGVVAANDPAAPSIDDAALAQPGGAR
jgi:NADH dehydrogenase